MSEAVDAGVGSAELSSGETAPLVDSLAHSMRQSESLETMESTLGSQWPERTAEVGYHQVRFGVEVWERYRFAARSRGLCTAELLRLIGWNLDRLLPYLELVPPKEK
jgi:hypothetical protein